jgi:hypothetical protein
MTCTTDILPGTGRWQPAGLTVGACLRGSATLVGERGPLHHRFAAVPLPVPGRN